MNFKQLINPKMHLLAQRFSPVVSVCILCLLLRGLSPIGHVEATDIEDCSHYADSSSGSDGNGSLSQPWNQINAHLDELSPGDSLCLRGALNPAASQIYPEALDLAGVSNGTASQPITMQGYPGEYVTIQSSDSVLTVRGANYWIFSQLTFDHLMAASDAIRFRDQASHNLISSVRLKNGTRDGIDIAGGSHDNHIEDFVISDFNWETNDAHCIVLDPDTDGTIIHGNVLTRCSGDGVQLFATDSTSESDYASGVQIIDNFFTRGGITRAENAIDIKGAVNLRIQGNTISGYFDNKAIVLQKGSQGTWIEGNTISDSERGLEIRGEDGKDHANVTILRNVFYGITGQYAVKFDEVTRVEFLHNTIADISGNAIRVEEEGVFGSPASNLFRNNLVYSAGNAYTTGSAIFQATVDHNGWFDTGTDPEFADTSDTTGTGDPGFVSAATHTYTLAVTSPAIDRGIDLGQPFFGTAPDLGAYEFEAIGFYLTVVPTAISIPAGGTASYTIEIDPSGGFSNTVDLSVGILPPLVHGIVTPAYVNPPGSATLVLTNTHASGPLTPGLFNTVQISAIGSGYAQTATITLLVGGETRYMPAILRNVP